MIVATTIFGLGGCTKENVDKLVTQVQEQTQIVQEEVTQAVATGSINLSLNGQRSFSTCNASLLVFSDGRPNVFQFRTYSMPDKESYPSVFFQGTTTAATWESLIGQSVSGELFVGLDNAGNLWQSDPASTCLVAIQGIEGSEIVCHIAPSRMLNPEGKDTQVSGPIRAIMNR